MKKACLHSNFVTDEVLILKKHLFLKDFETPVGPTEAPAEEDVLELDENQIEEITEQEAQQIEQEKKESVPLIKEVEDDQAQTEAVQRILGEINKTEEDEPLDFSSIDLERRTKSIDYMSDEEKQAQISLLVDEIKKTFGIVVKKNGEIPQGFLGRNFKKATYAWDNKDFITKYERITALNQKTAPEQAMPQIDPLPSADAYEMQTRSKRQSAANLGRKVALGTGLAASVGAVDAGADYMAEQPQEVQAGHEMTTAGVTPSVADIEKKHGVSFGSQETIPGSEFGATRPSPYELPGVDEYNFPSEEKISFDQGETVQGDPKRRVSEQLEAASIVAQDIAASQGANEFGSAVGTAGLDRGSMFGEGNAAAYNIGSEHDFEAEMVRGTNQRGNITPDRPKAARPAMNLPELDLTDAPKIRPGKMQVERSSRFADLGGPGYKPMARKTDADREAEQLQLVAEAQQRATEARIDRKAGLGASVDFAPTSVEQKRSGEPTLAELLEGRPEAHQYNQIMTNLDLKADLALEILREKTENGTATDADKDQALRTLESISRQRNKTKAAFSKLLKQ